MRRACGSAGPLLFHEALPAPPARRRGAWRSNFRPGAGNPGKRHRFRRRAAGGAYWRGFAMALDRFLSPIDDQELFVLARKEGKLMAFMTFSPWGKEGISLDRMLRSRDADTGVNELIITVATEYAAANKIARISLNFAAFRSIFEEADRISSGTILRFKRDVLRFFSKWVQIESLYRFNAKFQPEWNPRYLVYPSKTKLIEIGVAVSRAEGLI